MNSTPLSHSALVVDDETVSRLVLSHMLRRAGWDVTEADDVAPAIAIARSGTFTAIFSDFSMPGGTGVDLLNSLPPTPTRPLFVLVTGIVEHSSVGLDLASVIDGHLIKPISSRSLSECLATILPRQRDR
ncbi:MULTISPECIES: response regulator [unclassified Cryobacterium]|uniref:response regulator n=1 Tax=unclassified Cryobacterium TaxID=2649013 RepID=UPI002AB35E30|nr:MULTISPECIES: response regulator [unclassified Cryobacterium]MDY7541907.1 response regulator [Cryobacterium sp. 5B3]MEA9998603.1 response regulator [Cryobacterium sp. RTS3]MEB0266870.1 response regulator [Cryobacterium sp. 10I5]MEB0276083.1 response regulator [Cryobacterium sp. 5B3]